MIIQTKLLQDNCKKILEAVDSNTSFDISETVELEVRDQVLYLNVTNKEYYVSVKMPIGINDDLHAVVDAKLFLTLVSKLTTKEVELTTTETTLIVKSNGTYKIPLIYDGEGKVIKLPTITIENVTNSFVINNGVLQSILKYNSKELLKSGCNRPVQRLFYVDENGAITFTNGACVNSFTLEQPVTLFLTEKVIKLFKLFRKDVNFFIGQDEDNNRIVTKVAFTDGDVSLVSTLNIDSSITNTFPVKAIRGLADTPSSYSINVDKISVLDAINRLSLFASKNVTPYTYIYFNKDNMVVYDTHKENHETINYNNCSLDISEEYIAMFNTQDLRVTLETCDEQFINLSFGNHKAIVISRGTIKNIIPECKQ